MTSLYTVKNYEIIPSERDGDDGLEVTVYRNEKRLGTYTLPPSDSAYRFTFRRWQDMPDSDWKRLVDDAWDADQPKGGKRPKAYDHLVVGMLLEPIIEEYEQAMRTRQDEEFVLCDVCGYDVDGDDPAYACTCQCREAELLLAKLDKEDLERGDDIIPGRSTTAKDKHND